MTFMEDNFNVYQKKGLNKIIIFKLEGDTLIHFIKSFCWSDDNVLRRRVHKIFEKHFEYSYWET